MNGSETASAPWQHHKEVGDTAFKNGKYPVAAASYTKAIDGLSEDKNAKPVVADSIKIHSNRSLACLKMGDFNEALKDAKVAVGLEPTWQKGWFRLASALEGLGILPEAQIALETGLPLEPNNAEMRKLLDNVQTKAKTAAAPDSESAQQVQKDMRQFFQKYCKGATLLKERGSVDNVPATPADQQAQASPVKEGMHQAAPLSKQLKKKRRQQKKSAQASSRSRSGSPVHEVPATDAASAATDRLAQPPTAQDQSTPTEQAEPTFAPSQTSSREASPAEAAVPEPPSEQQRADAAKDEGNVLYKAGRYEAALAAYGRAISICPEVAAYYGNRAAAALMKRDYKLAMQDSLHATKLNPDFARGYQRAGKAYLCMGQLDEADAQYAKAVALEAGNAAFKAEAQLVGAVRSNLQEARQCLELGDPRQAQWHADKAVRLHSPAVETALMLKFEALVAAGKYQEALAESRSLTVYGDDKDPEVLTRRAQALYLTGNMDLAQNTYQVVLRLDPDNTSSRKGLKRIKLMNSSKNAGNEAFKAGKWREAEQHYTQALEVDSDLKSSFMAQCACNRAAAYLKLGNAEAALKDAELATELDPDYAKAYLRRGSAHQALEHFEDAVRDFEKVKKMDEETPNIATMLRDARLALKKSKRVDYYKLLELNQDANDYDLKRAYRKAALKYHPDKSNPENRDENEKKFKLCGEANTILSDPAKRQKYDAGWTAEEIDQGMQQGEDGTFGHARGHGMDDVFAQMFAGGMFGGGGGGGGGGGMPRGFRSRGSPYGF